MAHLLAELAICAASSVALAVIHVLGLMGLIRLTQHHLEHWRTDMPQLDRVLVPLTMVGGLFLLHGTEIWAYAVLLMALSGESFEAALFGSVAAYATVGVDTVGRSPWRLVGAYEGLIGMLLIGWSTAFLFANLHRIMNTEENHPLPEGAIAEEASVGSDKDGSPA